MFRFVVKFDIKADSIEEAFLKMENSILPQYGVEYETDQLYDEKGRRVSKKEESEIFMNYIMSAKEE